MFLFSYTISKEFVSWGIFFSCCFVSTVRNVYRLDWQQKTKESQKECSIFNIRSNETTKKKNKIYLEYEGNAKNIDRNSRASQMLASPLLLFQFVLFISNFHAGKTNRMKLNTSNREENKTLYRSRDCKMNQLTLTSTSTSYISYKNGWNKMRTKLISIVVFSLFFYSRCMCTKY